MNQISFKIYGMDCVEEVTILKRELTTFVDGDNNNITFDLLNGKITLQSKNNLLDEDEIIKTITKTGMKAVLWNNYVQQMSQEKTFWHKYGHVVMVIISALGLCLGFIFHVVKHSLADAFISGEAIGHVFPVISIIFYIIAIIAGGWFIFPKALYAAKKLQPDMNLLMVIAVIGAAVINQWFEAATVAFLFSGALLLESLCVKRTRRAIRALMQLTPAIARVIDNDIIKEQPVKDIPINTVIAVRPGEQIPMDSVLISGSTSVNQAPITGESMLIRKNIGDELFAGTINGDHAIQCRVTKAANDSTLAHIIRMVEEAQSRRAKSEQWVEKFAHYYTPLMMIFAILIATVAPLLFNGSWYHWIYEGLVILVVACPCALVISTPISIVAGLNTAARSGVLIKGGIYLEAPAHIKVVAIDKTGTLTRGEPTVQKIIPINNHSEEDLLRRAASLEAHSDHPLAKAIRQRAATDGIVYNAAEHFQVFKGKGAEGYIDGKLFWIGSHRFLHEKVGDAEPKALHEKSIQLEDAGHSIVAIGHDAHICGIISIADAPRSGSKDAMQALKQLNINKIIMLTGDNDGTAKAIANDVGIDDYISELLPEDKVKQIELLVTKYQNVAMIGDGINDAPALAASSLGIAMGAIGSDAAIETADIALMSDDLGKLAWLIKHSRQTLKIIKQNITFALGVKALFIILTIMGVANLWMAVAADMGASFVVIFNGLRLLKK